MSQTGSDGKDKQGGTVKEPEPKPIRDGYREGYREDRKGPDTLYQGGKPDGDRPPKK
jgi:hypothetical protein